MKLTKTLLVFLVLTGSLFTIPIKGEELPTIAVAQEEDGRITISSENKEVIDGFVSLSFSNEESEVVLFPEDATNENDVLFFEDPHLDGDFDYIFVYTEDEDEIAIQGSITLSTPIVEEEIIDEGEPDLESEELSLDQANYEVNITGKSLTAICSEIASKIDAAEADYTGYDWSYVTITGNLVTNDVGNLEMFIPEGVIVEWMANYKNTSGSGTVYLYGKGSSSGYIWMHDAKIETVGATAITFCNNFSAYGEINSSEIVATNTMGLAAVNVSSNGITLEITSSTIKCTGGSAINDYSSGESWFYIDDSAAYGKYSKITSSGGSGQAAIYSSSNDSQWYINNGTIEGEYGIKTTGKSQ